MRVPKLVLIASAFALTGAGCLGFGGGNSAAPSNDGGVYKTLNAGVDWTQQTAVPSARGVGTIAGTSVFSFAMDPEDNEVIYLGTRENGLLYTVDAAGSWHQPRLEALQEGRINAVAIDPTNTCTMFAAKDKRLYKTEDCLRSFNTEAYVETREEVQIARVAVDWFNADVVWLGLSNGDILKSEDGAETWRSVNTLRTSITGILVNNTDSRQVLVSTADRGFYKTVDGGANWVQLEDQLKDFRDADNVTRLIQDKTGGTVLAASEYGLLRSLDFGDTWEAIPLLTQPGQVEIKALGMDPENPEHIYYAASSTFYSTTTGGAPWATQRMPSTREPIHLIVDPADPNIVYLGVATVEEK